MDDQRWRMGEIARRKQGLVTLAELYELEITDGRVRHLVAAGHLLHVGPRTFRVNGAPISREGRIQAECLAAGPDALVSHRSAAFLYGLDGFDPHRTVHLTVPLGRRPQPRPDVRLHRIRDFHLVEPAVRQGIPVTGVPRLLLDLCATEHNPAIRRRALDSARKLKLVTWDELWAFLQAHSRRGRNGTVRLRELVELRSGKASPESGFEDAVLGLLISSGLPEPILQHWVSTPEGRFRIDAAYVSAMVGIECKGRRDHFTEAAFEADPVRENALAAEGWHIFTLTWQRLQTDSAGFVRQIHRALRNRQR